MSSGLLYLESSNFGVDKIASGQILCNSIKGFSVVLFYSQSKCVYSPKALAEFKRVVGTVNGVLFAVLNIDNNMDVVRLSTKTITPIDGVPYIMLYYNGTPQQIYNEEYPFTTEAIRDFTAKVSLHLTKVLANKEKAAAGSSQAAAAAKAEKLQKKNTIYYIGGPIRKNVTYLNL